MENFPFEHNGKTYWYSRSVVCSSYVYAKCRGRWYILADQRGQNMNLALRWNVPGGFLDHHETTQIAARREVFEETCVLTSWCDSKLVMVNSLPDGDLQHVIFSYVYNYGEVKELPRVSGDHNEPGECNCIAWVPLDSVDDLCWILDHKENIHKFFKTYITPNLWQRFKNWLAPDIEKRPN